MSKKSEPKGQSNGWKYTCSCGYETLQIGSAVTHLNAHKDHQLTRIDI